MNNNVEIKKRIDEVINKGKGDSFDDAYNLFNIIINYSDMFDEQVDAFQYVCKVYGTIESDESYMIKQAPYKNEKEELKENYGEIVNTLLSAYISKNCKEEEFYADIWKIIIESLIFKDEKSKVFALYYIIIDARIPYFTLGYSNRYSLSNEKYRELRTKYTTEIQRMRFILRTNFNQKTEKASSLLAELGITVPLEEASVEEIEDYERKVMQMVEILPEKKLSLDMIDDLVHGLR